MKNVANLRFSGSPQKSLKTCQHSNQQSYTLWNKGPLKYEKFVFFGGSFFIKNLLIFWIFYESNILSYLKNEVTGVIYCWNYGRSKLLLHFIEYHLDQLNHKYTKTAVNSKMKFFESRYQKKMSSKNLLKFFDPSTTKLPPCKIFEKWNGNHLLMANIFKLHKYQIFGLRKVHNMSKIWFTNNKFDLWKDLVYDEGAFEDAI